MCAETDGNIKLTRYSCKFVPCQSVTVIYRVLVCRIEMTRLLFKGKRLYAMGPEKARMKCDLNGFNTVMSLPCEFCNKVTEKTLLILPTCSAIY